MPGWPVSKYAQLSFKRLPRVVVVTHCWKLWDKQSFIQKILYSVVVQVLDFKKPP